MPVMIILFGKLTNTFVSNELDLCNFISECCFPNSTYELTFFLLITFEITLIFFVCSGYHCSYRTVRSNRKTWRISSSRHRSSTASRYSDAAWHHRSGQLRHGYVFVTCLNTTAERQVFLIRRLYLKSLLRQNIGWYDTNQTGDFASKMTEDLNRLQEGIGEKIGLFVFFITIFVASLINAFIHGWELTLWSWRPCRCWWSPWVSSPSRKRADGKGTFRLFQGRVHRRWGARIHQNRRSLSGAEQRSTKVTRKF